MKSRIKYGSFLGRQMHLVCNCKQEKESFDGMEAENFRGCVQSEAWEKKESRTYGTDWGRLLMFKLEVAKLAAAVGPVTGKEDTC